MLSELPILPATRAFLDGPGAALKSFARKEAARHLA